MLSVANKPTMLSVVMQSVIMLNVVMLIVVAPKKENWTKYKILSCYLCCKTILILIRF
jgi:hypothetical protein